MSLPGTVVPLPPQYCDNNGNPLAGGLVYFKVASSGTLKNTWQDAGFLVLNTNPVVLDGSGRANIFLGTGAYDVFVHDANDVAVTSLLGVEDIGSTFLQVLGNTLVTGARGVSPGYQCLSTDNFVTVNSNAAAPTAAVVTLVACAGRGMPLGIQNLGTAAQVAVTPAGSDTINQGSAGAAFVLPPAVGQFLPTVWLLPDGVSNWKALVLPNTSSPAQGVSVGYVFATGESALDGSNPTPIVTGLTTVISVNLTLKGNTAPGLGTSVLTYSISGGTISVFAWKPTSNSDPTLIASTGTDTFSWIVRGS